MLHKNNSNRWWLLLFVTAPLFYSSCKYDKEELLYPGTNNTATCATEPASFSADIFPLITTKCAISGCHDATASGGQIFQNYNQVSAAKDRIHLRAVVQKTMPAVGFLTTGEINALRCWIESGALNN
jgi:uncharacterized membrane protein